MTVNGLPQGITLMGFRGADAALMAQARWVADAVLKA
jgi:Asp-tRNA(Asn)/Glu-tRNA(Gln) amidotransferase A subunit family amidase